jgi:hypothetical protein
MKSCTGVALAVVLVGCGPNAGTQLPPGGGPPGKTADMAQPAPAMDAGTKDADTCLSSTVHAETAALPADIIWVIDNSGSMHDEEGYVQTNINSFSSSIATSGNDYHVIMITDVTHINVPPPLGGSPRFLSVNQFVDSNNALELVISTYPQWQSFLRPNAVKHFVIVTDDNSHMSASTFKTQMMGLTNPGFPNGFKLHAIVAESLGIGFPPGPCFGKAAAVGQVYIDLQMQTMGVFSSECQSNWAPVFTALANAVQAASSLPCHLTIPPPPMGQMLDYNQVNLVYTPSGGSASYVPYVTSVGNCGPGGGWYYDNVSAPTQLVACPATCTTLTADSTGSVSVAFGCATVIP